MKNDHNLCEHCNLCHPIDAQACSGCDQPLILDATDKIAIWRLGDIEDGLLGPVAACIRVAPLAASGLERQVGHGSDQPNEKQAHKGRAGQPLRDGGQYHLQQAL
jgi:hypothetical protein